MSQYYPLLINQLRMSKIHIPGSISVRLVTDPEIIGETAAKLGQCRPVNGEMAKLIDLSKGPKPLITKPGQVWNELADLTGDPAAQEVAVLRNIGNVALINTLDS